MKKLSYLIILFIFFTFTNAEAYLTKANWVGGTGYPIVSWGTEQGGAPAARRIFMVQ